MAETLRALARTLNLDGQIIFAGEATAVTLPPFYASADVFVLPTLYEGYGMAVAEALARGLPVVSTKTGAIAELVEGRRGLSSRRATCRRLARALSSVLARLGRSSAAGGRRPPRARQAADVGRCGEQDGRRAEPGVGLMGGFSADWLALREPSDARARSAALTAAVLDRPRAAPSVRILDLAAGTEPTLDTSTVPSGDRRNRHWLLADNDAALLARVPLQSGRLIESKRAWSTRGGVRPRGRQPL